MNLPAASLRLVPRPPRLGSLCLLGLGLVLGCAWAAGPPETAPTAPDTAKTNAPAAGESRREERRSDRSDRSERSAATAPAQRDASDYSHFRLITERNIFNAGRSGRQQYSSRETRRPSRVDNVSLVGVMTYGKGPFAFFDGSSSDYRKALQPGGSLGPIKVLAVQTNAVELEIGTNRVQLTVGSHLRREEEGEWKVSDSDAPSAFAGSSSSGTPGRSFSPGGPSGAASTTSSAGAASSSGGADNEVLRRLLQRREQENR